MANTAFDATVARLAAELGALRKADAAKFKKTGKHLNGAEHNAVLAKPAKAAPVSLTLFSIGVKADGANKGEQVYYLQSADKAVRVAFNAVKAKAFSYEGKGTVTSRQLNKIIKQFSARQFKVAIGDTFTA